MCPSDAHSAGDIRHKAALLDHSAHPPCHIWHATHPIAIETAPRARTHSKTTPARHTRLSHTTHQAHPSTACRHAAKREHGGVVEAHRPSAAAARGVRTEGEGGRPHRCFPLPRDMPLRTVSTARAQARSRRPQEALTCPGARTAHVESAPQEGSGEGANPREVGTARMRVPTGKASPSRWLYSAQHSSVSAPRASCDTARHMRSMRGLLRDGAREARRPAAAVSHAPADELCSPLALPAPWGC